MPATALAAKPLTTGSLTAARLALATALTFQVLLAALLFIRPELDPSWQPISEYAIGRHGWIMVGAASVLVLLPVAALLVNVLGGER